MKSKLCAVLLLVALLLITSCAEASKEFIPGVSLDQDMKNKFNWDVPLTVSHLIPKISGKAELIKNFGPKGEEALKLTMKKGKPFVVEVRYFPSLEVGFRYRLYVEYKANYDTEKGEEIGAMLSLVSHKGLSESTYIPLKNTSKWTKVEAEFDILNASSQSPFRIYFSLGALDPRLVFSSGELCFINLKIDKVEDLRDGLRK